MCLMLGMLASELAAGKLKEVAEATWPLKETIFENDTIAVGMRPMQHGGWDKMLVDLQQAKTQHCCDAGHMHIAHWQHRFWLAAGVALLHDEEARKTGRACMAWFERDPRQLAHHNPLMSVVTCQVIPLGVA